MSKSQGRNISISPELLAHAEQLVASGKYESVDAYVQELVRQDKHRQGYYRRLAELIQEGLDSGEPIEMTPEQLGGMLGEHLRQVRAERGPGKKAG